MDGWAVFQEELKELFRVHAWVAGRANVCKV